MLSGLPSIADMRDGTPGFRLMPQAVVSNRSKAARLFDHLVGTGEQGRRHFEAERLSGPAVDDKLEPGGAIDWHFGWLSPL
jgi:hypothetical protein